jgi:hypothetical protein
MAIKAGSAPHDAKSKLSKAMRHLLRTQPSADAPVMAGSVPVTSQPMPVFTLKLNDIQQGEFSKTAEQTGWRYLVVNGDASVGLADLKRSDGGSEFSGLTKGPIVKNFEDAVELADKNYAKDRSNYELRVLEIPAVNVAAVWLHGDKDVFIPYMEAGKLGPSVVREDPHFVSKVRSVAARRSIRRP